MFSPVNNAPQSTTARSSRRRPRPASSDSISQPKAKRQRSALSEQTFLSPDVAPEMEEANKSTVAVVRRESTKLVHTPRRDLTVRGKKPKSAERATSKGDGSVILTHNDTYTVSRLPAWPDRLQSEAPARQHGAIYSDSGYALSLTHTHALVWPYAVNTPTPETFTFALPHPSKHTSDALPLGSLVSASASSSEPGLVVVMPSSGKITYWESIASAATLDLIQQQRHGVEHSIQGMLSNETIIQILNAESAGFILGFSSGRLAYMSVRDSQGRPSLSIQFLRGSSGPTSGGLFGSLRNALSSSAWRGDLAAARAAPVEKAGEREIATATSKGRLQMWSLHRGGHNTMQAEAEARDLIVQSLKETDPSLTGYLIETFNILDLAFSPKPVTSANDFYDNAENGTHLLLLTSIGGREGCHYALVQVILRVNSIDIGHVRHLRSYTTPVSQTSITRPRLHLPSPALVAFVIFDRAVVVASMATQPESPDSQLQSDSHVIPASFEDVVDFRKDAGVEVVGSGVEEPHYPHHGPEDTKSRRHRAKFPAAVILVKGGGIIRIAATDPSKLTSNEPPQVTAKSKLEQAVFFGSQENNPISFCGRTEIQFTSKEIGDAALELSEEIISSSTRYIPSLPASVEQNLRRRAAALRELISHIKTIGVELDRVTKWKLLWDAEKMAGATLVWDRYDANLQTKPVGQKYGLINHMILFIHERYKTEPVAEAGELDRVRHWFINDIYRFQIAVPWAFQVVKYSYQEGQKDHATIMALASEADDFVTAALGAAYRFREENLGLYGLQDEKLESGILTAGHEGLPEFWTASHFIADNIRKQTDLTRALAVEYWQRNPTEGGPDPELVDKVRLDNVEMVDLCCTSNTERYRWQLAQKDAKTHNAGLELQESSLITREGHIDKLAEIGLVDEAIAIARKHKVFSTLSSLIIEESERVRDVIQDIGKQGTTKSTEGIQHELRAARLEQLFKKCFHDFGAPFAEAVYLYYGKRGSLFEMIKSGDEMAQPLTAFLRNRPEFSKTAWMNEVIREGNFDQASGYLLELALQKEKDLWSKKVELSIGKLARLAGRRYSQSSGIIMPDGGHFDLGSTKKQLALVQIQEKVFAHVHPFINAAIDEKAELQLALEVLGNKALKNRQAFSMLLSDKITCLLGHQALGPLDIVDLLTLMGNDIRREEYGLLDGQEFYYALEALKCGPDEKDEVSLTERVIWRRAMLRDDWDALNNTDLMDDRQVEQEIKRTALYSTLRACVKNRLFEAGSPLSIVSPKAALGASTKVLDERFTGLDAAIREPLLADMKAEDAELKHYIEKCRLDKWFEGAFDLAKQSVKDELNEQTEGGINMQEIADELEREEERISAASNKAARELLLSKPRYKPRVKLSGSMAGFRSSVRVV